MREITSKTLRELDIVFININDSDSQIMNTCRKYFDTPLLDIPAEGLRVLITQEIALPYIIPCAIEVVEKTPFTFGGYYFGDLLNSILSTQNNFWESYPSLYWKVYEIVSGLRPILHDMSLAIEEFELKKIRSK